MFKRNPMKTGGYNRVHGITQKYKLYSHALGRINSVTADLAPYTIFIKKAWRFGPPFPFIFPVVLPGL